MLKMYKYVQNVQIFLKCKNENMLNMYKYA